MNDEVELMFLVDGNMCDHDDGWWPDTLDTGAAEQLITVLSLSQITVNTRESHSCQMLPETQVSVRTVSPASCNYLRFLDHEKLIIWYFCQCYSAPAVLIKFILIRYIIPGTLGLFWLVAMWCSNRYEWSRSGQSSQLLKEKYWFVVLDYCPHGLLVKQVKNQLCFWNINILFDHSELFFLSCLKVQIPQSYVLTLLLTKSRV